MFIYTFVCVFYMYLPEIFKRMETGMWKMLVADVPCFMKFYSVFRVLCLFFQLHLCNEMCEMLTAC